MKQKKITHTMQEVAADILQTFIIHTWDGVTKEACDKFYDEVFKQYDLNYDPFTHFPCSNKEYAENNEEYQRQLMEERFGYYE